jgi:exodeoxyribonuclease VII large subunit
MRQAGPGALFEKFLQLKAKLEAQGLFDAARKRTLPVMPRAIGVVTSLGAAALHDVMTALQRRVPHIPVLLVPASVQGSSAPEELIQALSKLYLLTQQGSAPIDVILLVRGGGAAEDLWAFNDERLARTMVQSPVPVVCGVGHETDFTIADFVADLRAPTPTAAAELVAQPREVWLASLDSLAQRYQLAAHRHIDQHSQRLDLTASRLGRPSALVAQQRLQLAARAQQLNYLALDFLKQKQQDLQRASLRLGLLDPGLVLQRGYAWLTDCGGKTITSVQQARPGQALQATLADGKLDLMVADAN